MDSSDEPDKLEFLQMPGYPIKVRGVFTDQAEDGSYELTVNTYGDCANPGPEFNPLAPDAVYPHYNSYNGWGKQAAEVESDGRGELDNVVFEDNDGSAEYWMQYFLQNLAGKDSLIGRSITLTLYDEGSFCCTIGRDTYREPEEPDAPTITT